MEGPVNLIQGKYEYIFPVSITIEHFKWTHLSCLFDNVAADDLVT